MSYAHSMPRLPSLLSLRAFDVAARHLSLSAAARELSVTHGAVSRQVQRLEDRLGERLFERTSRGLKLTAVGRTLALGTQEAFARLATAVDAVGMRRGQRVVTISTLASLAARWLVPRMIRFQRLHPDLDLRVSTNTRVVDLERESIDLAVRYGRGPWPGLHQLQLFKPREYPVCAPRLAKVLCSPADLSRVTLLHDMTSERWAGWLRAAGQPESLARAGPVFEDMNVVLQAAIEGEGVALAFSAMVKGDLDGARLIKPFSVEVPVDRTFHVVCRPERMSDPAVRAVVEWLVEEAAAM